MRDNHNLLEQFLEIVFLIVSIHAQQRQQWKFAEICEHRSMISLLPQTTCFFKVSGDPVQSIMMDYLPLGQIFKEGAKRIERISQLGVIGCARPARAISTGRRTPDTRDLCSRLSEYHSISHQVPRLKDLCSQNTTLFPIKCLEAKRSSLAIL